MIFTVKTMTDWATQTIQETKSLTILQRIANKDKTAARDCIDTYGNFIWALARKFTQSTEEAEAATLEIFQDIWRYSKRGDGPQSAEDKVISQIARRLIKHLQ
jgi:RNA polymerase sigma-70 factor (ECF subfamily)